LLIRQGGGASSSKVTGSDYASDESEDCIRRVVSEMVCRQDLIRRRLEARD